MRGFLPSGGLGTTPWWQFYREMVAMLSIIGGSVELEVRELPLGVGGHCQAWAGARTLPLLRGRGCQQDVLVLWLPPRKLLLPVRRCAGERSFASLPFFFLMCSLNTFLISSHYFLPK